MTGPAGSGGARWIDAFLDCPYWEEVEAGLVGETILGESDIVTRFDPVVAGRVSGGGKEGAALVLGFKELGEMVVLAHIS